MRRSRWPASMSIPWGVLTALYRRGAILAASSLAVATLFGCVPASIGVGDFYQPRAGEVVFGRSLDLSRTMVGDLITKASKSDGGEVAFASMFSELISGDVHIAVSVDGEAPVVAGQPYTFSSPGSFYSGTLSLKDLPTGALDVRIVQGRTTLAQGFLMVDD
jgi:hypothetical protein